MSHVLWRQSQFSGEDVVTSSLLNPSPSATRQQEEGTETRSTVTMTTRRTHPVWMPSDRCVCVRSLFIGQQSAEQCIVGRGCFNVKSSCCSWTAPLSPSVPPSGPQQEVILQEVPQDVIGGSPQHRVHVCVCGGGGSVLPY